jgi:hypothetical protein
MGDEEVCREELPWVEDNRRDIPHVIRGDNSRLCHGDDVSAKGSEEARWEGSRAFLRCCGLARTIDEEKDLPDVMDPWDEMIEPAWFAMPIPPRTSGFPCSRLSLHCSRACAAEA